MWIEASAVLYCQGMRSLYSLTDQLEESNYYSMAGGDLSCCWQPIALRSHRTRHLLVMVYPEFSWLACTAWVLPCNDYPCFLTTVADPCSLITVSEKRRVINGSVDLEAWLSLGRGFDRTVCGYGLQTAWCHVPIAIVISNHFEGVAVWCLCYLSVTWIVLVIANFRNFHYGVFLHICSAHVVSASNWSCCSSLVNQSHFYASFYNKMEFKQVVGGWLSLLREVWIIVLDHF